MLLAEKLTEEQRVERAVVQIMRQPKYIFLTNILMIGRTEVIDAEITACTDGRNVLIGRQFATGLSDAELRFLILHENFHKLYRHIRIWKHLHDKDAQCANQACDYVINLQIKDENPDGFAVMPQGGCLDERFRGMNAGEVFDIIYQEKQEEGGKGGKGDDSGESIDEHDWEGAAEVSDEEADEQAREIERALRQGAMLAGQSGGTMSEEMQKLLRPKVDWRKVLREFVSEQCAGHDYATYARPNRRYIGSDIYLPTSVSEAVPELLVALDTSGSCWSALPYFLAEVKSICSTIKPHKLHLMFWDTNVVYEMHDGNNVEDLEVKDAHGGGGTDVNCVTTYLQEHNIKPTASVILTDGYLSNGWGKWDHPVLWCLVNNKTDVPPKGKFVRVENWRN